MTSSPQEVDDRVAAFLAELGTKHTPPWQDATEDSSDEKEQDR